MPRIRTVKPDFWKSEALSELPPETHMLACSLLNYSDDEGYFNANPKLIAAECCPLRELSVSVPDSLNHLVEIGYIRLGSCGDGKAYGHIINFLEHQFINRPSPSKISGLDFDWNVTSTAHGVLIEASTQERKGKERKGKEDVQKDTEGFKEFYKEYPNKKKPALAERSYLKAIKITDHKTIMEGLKKYIENKPEFANWAHPSTWLNDQRWLDEYEQPITKMTAQEEKDFIAGKMAEKGL